MDTPAARPDPGATWAAFAVAAPELATRVRARFAANRHHVVGTLRRDGAPRLSGTEVQIDDRAVALGMMGGSRKLADVRRDPRVEIHSAPVEDDLANGDAKLAGRLVALERAEAAHPGAGFFELLLDLVSVVRVDRDELLLTTWRPGLAVREIRRR